MILAGFFFAMPAPVGPPEITEAFQVDRLCIGATNPVGVPHLAALLAAVAGRLNPRKPVCIVVPSTEGLAELTAVLVAMDSLGRDAADMTKQAPSLIFVSGTRVRALVNGNVFQVVSSDSISGLNGFWLQRADKNSHETNARFFVKSSNAILFERTSRKRPFGPAGLHLKPELTALDLMAGATTYGNSCLMRNHVVLLSTRASFARFLEKTELSTPLSKAKFPNRSFSEEMCWGFVDDDGHIVVANPDGALGDAPVVVNREPHDLRKILSGQGMRTRTIVTSDLSAVLRHPGLFDEFKDNHSLLLLAESRRREDIMSLRSNGWTIWEPAPWEISPGETVEPLTGLSGLDVSIRGSRRELRQVIAWMNCRSPDMAALFQSFRNLSAAISAEAMENDDVVAALQLCKDAFFRTVALFEYPTEDRAADFRALLDGMRRPGNGFLMACGQEAAENVKILAGRLGEFLDKGRAGDPTSKGSELLALAAQGRKVGMKQFLAVGSSQSRLSANQFLARHDAVLDCRTASDLHVGEIPQRVIVTGALSRDAFRRMIDPWPAEVMMMLGYDFETDIYRSRLEARRRDQERLRVDDAVRTQMTGMAATSFGRPRAFTSIGGGNPLQPVETFIGKTERHADKRPVVYRAPGEEMGQATYHRFSGSSWAAFTPDHQCLLLDSSVEERAAVRSVDCRDLRVGQRIVMREQGERDVIRDIAEQLCGAEKYEKLIGEASLWRQALKRANCTPEMVATALAAAGVKRNLETIRSWLRNPLMFGPRQYSDLDVIAEAFGSAFPATRWDACSRAIHDLRSLHISAGSRLGRLIVDKLRDIQVDSSDQEIRIDLDVGSVWVVEIQHIDDALSEWPVSRINHLQWKAEVPPAPLDLFSLAGA